MAVNIQRISTEDFEAFVQLPENRDRNFELINGILYEDKATIYTSEIAARIGAIILNYLHQTGIKGHVTGANGGYVLDGDRLVPDVAYISCDRQPHLANDLYNPISPELVVEVRSPLNEAQHLTHKIARYLHAGTVVWVINPQRQTVDVFQPGAQAFTLDNTGTLDGGSVLPGFSLSVKDIFPPQE